MKGGVVTYSSQLYFWQWRNLYTFSVLMNWIFLAVFAVASHAFMPSVIQNCFWRNLDTSTYEINVNVEAKYSMVYFCPGMDDLVVSYPVNAFPTFVPRSEELERGYGQALVTLKASPHSRGKKQEVHFWLKKGEELIGPNKIIILPV